MISHKIEFDKKNFKIWITEYLMSSQLNSFLHTPLGKHLLFLFPLPLLRSSHLWWSSSLSSPLAQHGVTWRFSLFPSSSVVTNLFWQIRPLIFLWSSGRVEVVSLRVECEMGGNVLCSTPYFFVALFFPTVLKVVSSCLGWRAADVLCLSDIGCTVIFYRTLVLTDTCPFGFCPNVRWVLLGMSLRLLVLKVLMYSVTTPDF